MGFIQKFFPVSTTGVSNTGTLTSGKAILGNGGTDIFASRLTLTNPATGATFTLSDNKTFTVSNTLTLTGTDNSSINFGAGGTVAFTSNKISDFSLTSSAELISKISDETGTGSLVFSNSPTLVTPTLGVAAVTTLNGLTISSSTGILSITNSKTLAVGNTLTFSGTDSSSIDFGGGGTVAYKDKLNIFTLNGAVSASANTFNGTWYTGGSATTTKPYFLVETTGATSTNWSTSGTGLAINSASGFAGDLFNCQTNAVNKFKVGAAGNTTITITSGDGLSVLNSTTDNGTAGIYVNKTGVVSNTSYGASFNVSGANITNYGFYVTSVGATNNYGLFVASGMSHFASKVGMGPSMLAPSAYLQFAAGTATANTAPIKFTATASALLSAVELGALEFVDDGTTGHLYITRNVVGVVTRTLIV